ncbi:MAG: DUF6084 family protein [Ginsengibacter sp.]
MPELKFDILSAEVRPYAALPTIVFKLQITNEVPDEEVYAAALKCQIMIEAIRRQYDEETKKKLYELFGEPQRWGETLKSLVWMIVNIPVPRFTGKTVVEIAVPCSEDQGLAAGKYFYAVKDEKVPVAFLFSGTLFFKGSEGQLQVSQVPWEKEAAYKMPACLWHEMMEEYFPNCRWLRIRKEIYDKLVMYKAATSHATLENCLEAVLEEALLCKVGESSRYHQ